MTKVKKQNTIIDMTAMSDITVLLLTFFMLTSTFISKEPIQITTPRSISGIKIPETNVMTILIDINGKIFISLNYQQELIVQTLKEMGKKCGCEFTQDQCNAFKKIKFFGVPIRSLATFLNLSSKKQDEYVKDLANLRVGIPSDSTITRDNEEIISTSDELTDWISYATKNNPDLQIAIRADQKTQYSIIKKVMNHLRGIRKNRCLLITNLKTADS